MKLKTHVILALAAGLFVCAGCADKMQSELSMKDVEKNAGSCTIQGTVSYNSGTTDENGIFVTDNVKPAAEVDVLVSVDYDAYGDGSKGKKQFTAKTDANGNYSIVLPVGSKPIAGTKVEVDILPFKRTFSKEVNGAIKAIENAVFNDVAYTVGKKNTPLENGKVEICNMLVTTKAVLDPNGRSQVLKITGATRTQGEKKKDSDDATKGLEAATPKVSNAVLVKITYEKMDGGEKVDKRELKYHISSNGEGFYTLDATFFDTWEYDEVKVEVTSKAYYVTSDNNSFMHYYSKPAPSKDWYSQRLAGVYQETTVSKDDITILNAMVPVTIDITMPFKPDLPINEIYGIGKLQDSDGNALQQRNPNNWM